MHGHTRCKDAMRTMALSHGISILFIKKREADAFDDMHPGDRDCSRVLTVCIQATSLSVESPMMITLGDAGIGLAGCHRPGAPFSYTHYRSIVVMRMGEE